MDQPFRVTIDNVVALARLMEAMGLTAEASRMHEMAGTMVDDLASKLRCELSGTIEIGSTTPTA